MVSFQFKTAENFVFSSSRISCDKNTKLFKEDIVVSDIGPVIQLVYKRFSVFGGASIFYIANVKCPKLVDEDKIIIDDMLKELNKYSSVYLTQLTLNQSPWMKNYSKYKQKIIQTEEIKIFLGIIQNARQNYAEHLFYAFSILHRMVLTRIYNNATSSHER